MQGNLMIRGSLTFRALRRYRDVTGVTQNSYVHSPPPSAIPSPGPSTGGPGAGTGAAAGVLAA
jgi:hypothetical protein